MMENYYEILGIKQTADSDEIKRAYRYLASRHHPDKGGDTAVFQKIQQAYDVLSDQNKRAEYDQQHNTSPGFRWNFDNDPSSFTPFEEIFGFHTDNFFRRRTHQRKNRNIKISITVGLEETLGPIEKIIQIQHGNELKNVRIDIPPGVCSHQNFKYSRLGDNSIANVPPGDLLVEVIVASHEKFQVSGNDLITTLSIDCLDAITGITAKIQSIEGNELEFNIYPGTSHGAKYKLKGQGLLVPNSTVRGDLFIVINLVVKKYSDSSIEIIKKIKSQLNEDR